jgi:hypothetical protein
MTAAPQILEDHENDELLFIEEAAAFLRASVATMRDWRHKGIGPPSFKVGRHVRYWKTRSHPLARRASPPSTRRRVNSPAVQDQREDAPWPASRGASAMVARPGAPTTGRLLAPSAARASPARSTPSGSSPAWRTPR